MNRHSPSIHRQFPVWWLATLPLLLAALWSSSQLDDHAFNRDEPDSLLSAGIYSSGPATLQEVWKHVEETRPNQSQGWSMLLFLWGRVAGWSEPAIRSLSFFAGLLTLAWIYRAGRDLFSPGAGLLAALLTSASAFLLSYMVIARVFAPVALFTTMIVWSYWRLAIDQRKSGPGPAAILLTGCVGLLYSHYFNSLFLAAPALFHLLFIPKNRRWRLPVLLLAVALAIALPQAPGLLEGVTGTRANTALNRGALDAAAIPDHLLHFLSNFVIRLPWPGGQVLLALMPLALAYCSWRRLRNRQRADAGWLAAFVAATAFLIMVAANEAARVMTGSRIRYMMPMLPLIALLAGRALHDCNRAFPRASPAVLALWLFLGPALMSGGDMFLIDRRPSTIHHVHRILERRAATGDLVVFRESLKTNHVLYLRPEAIRQSDQSWNTAFRNGTTPLRDVVPVHSPYHNIWLVYPDDQVLSLGPDAAAGRRFCERQENVAGFTLERHTRAASDCDGSIDARLEFDSNIQLSNSELSLAGGFLSLEAGLLSADDYLLAHYSLAVHVIDPRTGERVAQGDLGVGRGSFVPLRSEIDASGLPGGDYEVHVALYDWQTGERLPARDLVSGLVSDMHVLHHFRID